MAKRRSDLSPTGDGTDELRAAVERLTEHVQTLTQAIDELFNEVQWRNNNHRPPEESSSPPMALRSMPADPTTDDWQLNRVPPEEVAELRQWVSTSAPEPFGPPQTALDQLCREIADLRQIVAAFAFLAMDGFPEELGEPHQWLLEWASQEFDQEILRTTLSDIIADLTPAARPQVPSRSEHQQHLFSKGDADGD